MDSIAGQAMSKTEKIDTVTSLFRTQYLGDRTGLMDLLIQFNMFGWGILVYLQHASLVNQAYICASTS